jgi:acetyl-CoA acyltransferase 2
MSAATAATAGRVFIVSARRTPFGTFGGRLKAQSATDLAAAAARAALAAARVKAADVDTLIAGSVLQTAPDAAFLPRHAALRIGMQVGSTALGVNRLCGSGLQAAVSGAHAVRDGAELVLAVGSESMSQAPLSMYGQHVRFGTRFGAPPPLVDTLSAALADSAAGCTMGDTAEAVARLHGVSREDSDAYALASQRRFESARAAGRLSAELAPLELPAAKRGAPAEAMLADEFPRPATTAEGLAKLAPVFGGVVTAGSASGITDGAAALLLASEAALAARGLTPLAELRAWAVAGVEPKLMGLGPVPALLALTAHPRWPAGLALADVAHVEINEAFAAQVLGCERALAASGHALDPRRLNPNGGESFLAPSQDIRAHCPN